jgi:RNA polymerase sigma-54 factor
MQKLTFKQQLLQKLSPQQIQFIKLLQIPTAELESRIEEELEINPSLEEGSEESNEENDDFDDDYEKDNEDISIDEYLQDEDYAGYKMQGDGGNPDNDDSHEMPIPLMNSLNDLLITQLSFLRIDEKTRKLQNILLGALKTMVILDEN